MSGSFLIQIDAGNREVDLMRQFNRIGHLIDLDHQSNRISYRAYRHEVFAFELILDAFRFKP